jgi:hypothetical protein
MPQPKPSRIVTVRSEATAPGSLIWNAAWSAKRGLPIGLLFGGQLPLAELAGIVLVIVGGIVLVAYK